MAVPPQVQTPADRFSQTEVWGRLPRTPPPISDTRRCEKWSLRAVQTILDVGCGDGAITNRLGEEWDVTGVDMSTAALEHVTTAAIQASATELPLADGWFDLVASIEMLEHLWLADYRKAISPR